MWITRLHRGFCLYHIISAVFWGGSSASALATLVQIFPLSLDVKMCLLTTNIDAGGRLFLLGCFSSSSFFFLSFLKDSTRAESRPLLRPLFSLERLFVFLLTSESSSALAKALFWGSSGVLECDAKMLSRWFRWKSSSYFPRFDAGSARCQVSRRLVIPFESVW